MMVWTSLGNWSPLLVNHVGALFIDINLKFRYKQNKHKRIAFVLVLLFFYAVFVRTTFPAEAEKVRSPLSLATL